MNENSKETKELKNSLYAPWDWQDTDSFKKELISASNISNDNIKALKKLAEEVDFKCIANENPVLKECQKLKHKYSDAKKNVEIYINKFKENTKHDSSEIKQIRIETDKLQKEFDKLIIQVNKSQEDLNNEKKNHKLTKQALDKAYEYYKEKFHCDIEVFNETDDVYVAKLYFCPNNKNHPVSLWINRNTNEIINFEADTVLSPLQLQKLKQYTIDNKTNVLTLIGVLRYLFYEQLITI